MAKQIQISVPKPCHEDWNKMTPEQKGRFCGVCSKTVVDFTLMTDGQILDIIKNTKGETCGHFSTDQLNRPLVQPLQPKWYMVGMWKYVISGFLIIKSGETKAQLREDVVVTARCTKKISKDSVPRVKMGIIAYTPPLKINEYKGTIKDEHGEPIEGVMVQIKGTSQIVMTNANGYFHIRTKTEHVKAIISCIGYETKEVVLTENKNEFILNPRNVTVDGMMVVIKGKVAFDEEEEPIQNQIKKLTVTIKDEEGNFLPSANIKLNRKGQLTQQITDQKGTFQIKKIKKDEEIKITVNHIGYKTKEITLLANELEAIKKDIIVEKLIIKGEDVVVTGMSAIGCRGGYVTGSTTMIKGEMIPTVDSAQTIKSSLSPKIPLELETEIDFAVYPNPIKANQPITITYHSLQKETIMFRLSNADGKILSQHKHFAIKGKNTFQINIPSIHTTEMVIIQLMNSKGQWVATKKLLVSQ